MFKIMLKFIKITFKIHPFYYVMSLIDASVNAFRILLSLYATKWIIDAVLMGSYEQTLLLAALLVGLQLILHFMVKLMDRLKRTQLMLLRQKLDQTITDRIMQFDYEKLENPYYLDLKERAKFANDNQGAAHQLLTYITQLIASITTILSLTVVLFLFDYVLVLVLLAVLILYILIFSLSTKFQLKLTEEIIPINRKFGYYLRTLLDPENAKEYRFSQMNQLIHHKTETFTQQSVSFIKRTFVGLSYYEWFNNAINYIQMGFTYIYVAMRVISGVIPISEFILYTTSAFNISNQLSEVVRQVADIKRNAEFIKPMLALLEVPIQTHDDETLEQLEKIESIVFENVSFKYPHTEQWILKDVSFEIKSSEKISIVGLNGAGKTTLVKLISRFYKATEGRILINGKDIWSYQYESYMKRLAAVFQDYKIFAYSIADNINGGNHDVKGAYQAAKVVSLSQKIDNLKQGIDSKYSKNMYQDGIELSGGEQQKIAISRALYKKSDVVILDEPTAALDPFAEAEIYEHFNELVTDKIAIYISHRMSSSVFCDRILVLNQGIVEDFLPHQELMKKQDSLYYQLFKTQAKNYQS